MGGACPRVKRPKILGWTCTQGVEVRKNTVKAWAWVTGGCLGVIGLVLIKLAIWAAIIYGIVKVIRWAWGS
jgi:hypothetical protein